MLNLLPALLFLLVQGQADPDAGMARADALRRLATYCQLEAQTRHEASVAPAISAEPLQLSPQSRVLTDPATPATRIISRSIAGFGSSMLTRAGPQVA